LPLPTLLSKSYLLKVNAFAARPTHGNIFRHILHNTLLRPLAAPADFVQDALQSTNARTDDLTAAPTAARSQEGTPRERLTPSNARAKRPLSPK
jgi:hypothetical protein